MSNATDTTENTVPQIDPDVLASVIDSIMYRGYVFKDYTTITDQETEAAYALATQLIDQRQYAKAERLFEFLCCLDFYRSKYWLGLGVCRQLQSNPLAAIPAYSMAGATDLHNPAPPLRAAECYLAVDRIDDAENCATAAVHWASQQPENAKLKARAELILENIQGKRENQPCRTS